MMYKSQHKYTIRCDGIVSRHSRNDADKKCHEVHHRFDESGDFLATESYCTCGVGARTVCLFAHMTASLCILYHRINNEELPKQCRRTSKYTKIIDLFYYKEAWQALKEDTNVNKKTAKRTRKRRSNKNEITNANSSSNSNNDNHNRNLNAMNSSTLQSIHVQSALNNINTNSSTVPSSNTTSSNTISLPIPSTLAPTAPPPISNIPHPVLSIQEPLFPIGTTSVPCTTHNTTNLSFNKPIPTMNTTTLPLLSSVGVVPQVVHPTIVFQ